MNFCSKFVSCKKRDYIYSIKKILYRWELLVGGWLKEEKSDFLTGLHVLTFCWQKSFQLLIEQVKMDIWYLNGCSNEKI